MEFNALVSHLLNERYVILSEDNVGNIEDVVDLVNRVFCRSDELIKQWCIRETKRFIANTDLGLPAYSNTSKLPPWAKNTNDLKEFISEKMPNELYDFIFTRLRNAVEGMALWDKKTQSKILKMSLSQVEVRNKQLLNADSDIVEGRDVITVMSFDNGLKWKKLLTAASYQCHGKSASNCVSTTFYIQSKKFSPDSLKKETRDGIYGLYNDTNAKATLGIRDNKISEVAFFGEKYKPYILELIKKYKLVPEVYCALSDSGLCKWPPYEEYLDSIGYDRETKKE